MNESHARIARAWAEIIDALGYPQDAHTVDSPERVARFMARWHTQQAAPPKLTVFPRGEYDGVVITRSIPFYSMCAHHGLPFFGTAVVGYLPSESVVGLSKLARVVDYYAHRFQVQEQLTAQIAQHLEDALSPRGVGVILRGEHLCMSMRGVERPGHQTVTSEMRGVFREDSAARAEFLSLADGGI